MSEGEKWETVDFEEEGMRTIAKVPSGWGTYFEQAVRKFRGTPWQRMDRMCEVLFNAGAEHGATIEIDLAMYYDTPQWMQWHRDILARKVKKGH